MSPSAALSDSTLDLLRRIESTLKSDKASSRGKEGKELRAQACALARKLSVELEEPGDLIDRIAYQTQENAVLRIGLDLGIYSSLVQSEGAVKSQDIAKEKNADPILVERILRNLTALGHVHEAGAGIYTANKVTRAFTTQKGVSLTNFSFEFATPAWNQIPAFLKANGYRNPVDPLDAAVQRAFNSKKHFFDIMVDQNVLEMFQDAMSSYREDRAEFLDVFPAKEQLIQECDGSGKVLFVDVGGGRGQEVMKLRERFPDATGRMVLQDQEDVISQVTESDGMELMVHDFFTPQPVKGARCYYFRMIMHDWPDDKCIDILKNTVTGMEPGYSKLIINDIVLPDQGATRFAAQSDMNMLALLAAMERSETQWRQLLEKAGLEVVKIWPGVPESVIEATFRAK